MTVYLKWFFFTNDKCARLDSAALPHSILLLIHVYIYMQLIWGSIWIRIFFYLNILQFEK